MRRALSAICGLVTLAVVSSAQGADPTTKECVTASEASLTLRVEHKLRAARAQATTCAAATCPSDVREECTKRVEQLNAAIPTIVFEVKDGSGNDLTQVKVTMDGELLVEKVDGTSLSLDPGEHKFVFETAGQPPIEKVIVLREGDKQRRETIVLGPVPSPGPATTSASDPPSKHAGADALAVDRTTGTSPMWTVGWVVTGVGVVGLGLGTLFGLKASSSKSDGCGADHLCDSGKLTDAKSAATLSTIGFIAGGVLLAGGLTLVILAPKGESRSARIEAAPYVGVTSGGFVLRGSL